MCLGSTQTPHTALDPGACTNLFKFTLNMCAPCILGFFLPLMILLFQLQKWRFQNLGRSQDAESDGVKNCSRNPDFQFRSLHKCTIGRDRCGAEINTGKTAIKIKNIRGFIIGQVFLRHQTSFLMWHLGAKKKIRQPRGHEGKVSGTAGRPAKNRLVDNLLKQEEIFATYVYDNIQSI